MKIVQLQFSTKSAGSSALRLQEGFNSSNGIESYIVSLFEDDVPQSSMTYLGRWSKFKAMINNKISKRKYKYDHGKYGLYSYPFLGTDVSQLKEVQDADIIYIHWVQLGFLNFNSFKRLFEMNKRIFIVMHDMWFMTGGCHYAINCDSYMEQCTDCPIFPENNSIASSQHLAKLNLISKYGKGLEFISPSLWLKKLALKSTLLRNEKIHFLPNYFNSPYFKKSSQKESRMLLGVDTTKLVISFGAVNITSVYKGWKFLKEAFLYLQDIYTYDQVEVVIFGNGDLSEFEKAINFKIHYLGFLEDEEVIAHAYKSSDVFVIPSILDNQPTTVVESIHCGVPVVGFNLCGIPEMITHKESGYIAEAYNSKDLADGIHYCLENELNVQLKDIYMPASVLAAHYNLLHVN